MSNQNAIYPNLNWKQFEVFNDDANGAFEDMCRDLFYCEYLHERRNPHSDHNTPGVEIIPILEPVRDDGQEQKFISFQAKYFEKDINNANISDSLEKAVKYFQGKLGRVYLFCNRVISKNSKRFKDFQKILLPADIELELVTDKDIFTLLKKHKRVADYYFQDRTRSVGGANNVIDNTPIISSVIDTELSCNQALSNPLVQGLIDDRIKKCKEAICDLNFGILKNELSVLGIAVEANKRIAFYQLILAAYNRENFDEIIKIIPDELKEEAYWLKRICKNSRDISFEEIQNFSPETQITTLIILFTDQRWNNIVEIHKEIDCVNKDILKAYEFHYALALFNLRREEEAHNVLFRLSMQYHEYRFELYDICAQLNKLNQNFIYGNKEIEQKVKGLLDKLDRVKELSQDQLKGNGNLIATIELQSCFNLGVTEKRYIDEAITRYNNYSDSIKKYDGVRFFLGMCYEIAGDYNKAVELLSLCSWQDDEGTAARYLTLLVDSNKPDEAINAYDRVIIKTPRTESVYLLALSRVNDEKYEMMLKEAVDKPELTLDDLFLYGFYVENKDIFHRVVLPRISDILPNKLNQSERQTKIGLLSILAYNEEINLLDNILDSISDLENINLFVVRAICNCVYDVARKVGELRGNKNELDKNIICVEKIANRFYEKDILKKEFLQVKILCASISDMEFSLLKYLKELFEFTHSVHTARNIIALLYKRNETRKEEYEPYLESLKESEDPRISIVVSSALWKLGKYDDADFYAYKALYNLNGKEDFEVYKGIFGYYILSLSRIKELPTRKVISGNMIVSLKSENEVWHIALDSESDFGDKNNNSLGVEHINKQDQIYNKLLGCGKNQVLNIRGKKYKVIDFEPREIVLGRFIFRKIAEKPDKYDVQTITNENSEEMIRHIISLSDQRSHIQKLTDLYNFKEDQLGIPIDFFASGNYEKYIATVQYLLYSKDLAFYAGEPSTEYVADVKFIPTLSTIVLLALHNWLEILDWIKEIIIPESYMDFFKEQYAHELETQNVSEGALVPLDNGKYTILKRDKKISEMWEKIINKCESYPVTTVTDEERIAFEVVDNYTWERLFGKINIDKMQLDGLIVAERENGIYLCDDLFFRKIATLKKVKNINTATLLYAQDNYDDVMPIIIELSKTNYIYTPIICRDEEELNQLLNNLFEGELKKSYYSNLFNAYLDAYKKLMENGLDEEWMKEDIENGYEKE